MTSWQTGDKKHEYVAKFSATRAGVDLSSFAPKVNEVKAHILFQLITPAEVQKCLRSPRSDSDSGPDKLSVQELKNKHTDGTLSSLIFLLDAKWKGPQSRVKAARSVLLYKGDQGLDLLSY